MGSGAQTVMVLGQQRAVEGAGVDVGSVLVPCLLLLVIQVFVLRKLSVQNRHFFLVMLGHLWAAGKAVVKVAAWRRKGQCAARGWGPSFGSSLLRESRAWQMIPTEACVFPIFWYKIYFIIRYRSLIKSLQFITESLEFFEFPFHM